jgi:hypothetical protein
VGQTAAQAAGAIQDEMPDMLLSIAPVAGLGRSSAPPRCGNRARVRHRAALEEPDDYR